MDSGCDSRTISGRFISWQCRLRQKAMRKQGGRPSSGMRPRVIRRDGRELAAAITVLILEKEPEATTDMFRHIVRKTYDHHQCYQEGLRILASSYFQNPEDFSEVLTALFPSESAVAATLVKEGQCELQFQEGNQSYHISCFVEEEPPEAPAYQAAYFHNRLFNPVPPPQCRVLAFHPLWNCSSASPSD